MNKVDAILTADWHLRDSQPLCRTDNFFETQWNKISYICDLQEKHDCPVLHAGDLFHFWKPSPYLLSHALQLMPDKFMTVYGNHDLPAHRLEESNRSGVHTLEMADKIEVSRPGSWGWELSDNQPYYWIEGKKVFVWHKFVWMGKKPYPQANENDRVENIMELPELKVYDLILTGDHHSAFSYRHHDGRLLVNAGQITRQVANAKKPYVWLYNAEENTAVQHEIPHDIEHVSRVHLDLMREKADKLDAFIDGLSDNFDLGAKFEENLERYIEINKIKKQIVDIIWEAVNG